MAPAASLASVNTHDMPTFAGFRNGLDIDERVERGLLAAASAEGESEGRKALMENLARFLRRMGTMEDDGADAGMAAGCLAHLAAGPARYVLAKMEDLWGETEPQNAPGTGPEKPNWRRKARYSLEEIIEKTSVLAALRRIDRLRNGKVA